MSSTPDDERWCHCYGRRQWAEAERETLCGVNSTRSFQHTPFLNVHHRSSYRWIAFRWSRRRCSIRADSVSRNFVIIRLPLSTFWRSNYILWKTSVFGKEQTQRTNSAAHQRWHSLFPIPIPIPIPILILRFSDSPILRFLISDSRFPVGIDIMNEVMSI